MKGDHIVIFPFMAKGHTVPLLHLAASLADRDILVTLITTPGNAPFIRRTLDDHQTNHPDNLRLLLIPFPSCPPLPSGIESTDHLPSLSLYPTFLQASSLLLQPFNTLFLRLCRSPSAIPPPLCLVSDFFLGWTLEVCDRLAVPRLVFHGMGAFSMAICKSLWVHRPHDGDDESFAVPGMPERLRVTAGEVPDSIRSAADYSEPTTQFIAKTGAADVTSWGVLVNSFAELEADYVAPFKAFYSAGARAWLVGPLSLLSPAAPAAETAEIECLRWLEGREAGTVVYVSFGTQTHVGEEQLDEVAHGLAASECDFVWVVRGAEKWAPPAEAEERWGERGRVERGWAPQREALESGAVGGFVSHCGWNSVLESVAAGVPMLAWPMMAEQGLNAKLLVEELGMAIGPLGGMVGRKAVCEGVRQLMGGEKGEKARRRAAELRKAARAAVGEGGTSRRTLEKLIEELRRVRDSNNSSERSELEGEVDASGPLEWQYGGIQMV